MRIQIVTPAPPRSRSGNRVTAVRWGRILRELGHRVEVVQEYVERQRYPELLIALHARRSYSSVSRFHRAHPDRTLILALTGTDLYGDIETSAKAKLALECADRFVVLQPRGVDRLPPRLRRKCHVVPQSAQPAPASDSKSARTFDVCVVGHLRPVKDPFRCAEAVRRLPATSRVRVLHLGAALTDATRRRAAREMESNPRYKWLGELPRWQVRRVMARSHALVHTSRKEGGANVVSEALVSGLPILASDIPGSTGMLGEDHPGLFEVANTAELTALLARCESDARFLSGLARRSRRLGAQYRPERESAAWRELLREIRV